MCVTFLTRTRNPTLQRKLNEHFLSKGFTQLSRGRCAIYLKVGQGFPGGSVVKKLLANTGEAGSIPGLEDPTRHGATKPMHHNYWFYTPEPRGLNDWAHVPELRSPKALEPMLHSKRKACAAMKDPAQPHIKRCVLGVAKGKAAPLCSLHLEGRKLWKGLQSDEPWKMCQLLKCSISTEYILLKRKPF